MDIRFKQAILHVVDRELGDPVISQVGLDLTSVSVREYLTKKIEKLASEKAKTGTLVPTSTMATIIKTSEEDFTVMSQKMVAKWYEVYQTSEDAPSADVLIALFDQDEQLNVAFLKLNYHQSYTHLVNTNDQGQLANELIVHKSILAGKTQKADEGFRVNVADLSYELDEKRYTFSGDREFYLSTKVIESEPLPSLEESVKLVTKTAKKVGKSFDVPDREIIANVKEAIQENIEEHSSLDTQQIAQKVFKDNPSAQSDFKDSVVEKGYVDQVPMSNEVKQIATKKYGKQKLKLSNGIELIVPLEVYQDPNLIEFINNPDGTISVTIKNVEDVISRL
ncbi:nucleoid-associated protein [Paucilactobacillus kaifaensis]|uniref:nucleoid-associated protein n=1 Tax=Paucilactobacillus kaifaensis TaxID=2559921 RepID=UPI0010F6BC35|nr:nucleoid-associated protein [Paucilactobacillus kaifaensis]